MSSNQPADVCSRVDYDFAIVKMSGNPRSYSWDYVNPFAQRQADDAYRKCGLLGLYHFTWGREAPEEEARLFVTNVRKLGYLGKAMLVVDYEGEALQLGRSWLSALCKEVERFAGYRPVIYSSGSVITSQRLFALGYPIWCANYYKGYRQVDGYDTSGMDIYSGCESAAMWQFTSSGRLDGYSGNLDLNVFFGSEEDFEALTH